MSGSERSRHPLELRPSAQPDQRDAAEWRDDRHVQRGDQLSVRGVFTDEISRFEDSVA
jgi:hypothetical protein